MSLRIGLSPPKDLPALCTTRCTVLAPPQVQETLRLLASVLEKMGPEQRAGPALAIHEERLRVG
jgi:hypothetical protein